MNSSKPESQRDQPSTWSRGRRDLATPQGSNLLTAFLLCAVISLVIDVAGGRLHLAKSIIVLIIAIANIIILAIYARKISYINKMIRKRREDAYKNKFGIDYSEINKINADSEKNELVNLENEIRKKKQR